MLGRAVKREESLNLVAYAPDDPATHVKNTDP